MFAQRQWALLPAVCKRRIEIAQPQWTVSTDCGRAESLLLFNSFISLPQFGEQVKTRGHRASTWSAQLSSDWDVEPVQFGNSILTAKSASTAKFRIASTPSSWNQTVAKSVALPRTLQNYEFAAVLQDFPVQLKPRDQQDARRAATEPTGYREV